MTDEFKLKSGLTVPAVGLGTWQLTGEECYNAVKTALEIGYRYIDTAERYGNHKEVAKGGKDSGIARKDIFITSKVFYDDLEYENVIASCEQTLRELKTDYLDLYLVHWPNKSVPIEETMSAMAQLKKQGKIKAIGVSNFTIHHLEDVFRKCPDVEIENNQVEFHPSLNQKQLKEFCDEHGILLTAYSPIAQGHDLNLPTVVELSEKYSKSPAQVILNWLIGKGIGVIPRSRDKAHLADNLKALDWKLEDEDMQRLESLNENYRVVNPDFNEFDY